MHWLHCLSIILLVYSTMASTIASAVEAGQVASPTVEIAPTDSAVEAVQARRTALEQRVIAKWNALIHRDFAVAYSFASPGYRKLYSLDIFKSGFGNKVAWRRIEVVDIGFKGSDAATVTIIVYAAYDPPEAQKTIDMKSYVHESWVFVDGQWWYLVQN